MYGLKPGEDPENVYSYYGGTLGVNDSSTDLFDCLNTRYPKGSKIFVTLTPTAPLIDGSKGKSLNYGFGLERLNNSSIGFGSIPLGVYRATAAIVLPTGAVKSLKAGTEMLNLGDSAIVTWQGSGNDKEMLSLPQLYLGG